MSKKERRKNVIAIMKEYGIPYRQADRFLHEFEENSEDDMEYFLCRRISSWKRGDPCADCGTCGNKDYEWDGCWRCPDR